jgi:hypothetical protein
MIAVEDDEKNSESQENLVKLLVTIVVFISTPYRGYNRFT